MYNPKGMSESILRMIDENGKLLPGARPPQVEHQFLLRMFRAMLFSRIVDERMTKLQRQGRIGFFVGSTGEEAAVIGSALALQEKDWLVPCYREAGAAFLRGYPLHDFLSQVFGNKEDRLKGRQMPCHWGSPELRLASVSSPVGTQIPQATGIAMASKFTGRDEVTLVYFGDGATSTGDFHVGCNFAGVYGAPVVFLCRNNQWAISVPLARQTAAESIAAKAKGYGIEGVQVDGNDVLAVYAVTVEAVEKARSGGGPTLIEALTYRQGAHSTSDDPRAYREESEVGQWKKKDPISRFGRFLRKEGVLTEDLERQIRDEIDAELLTAIKQAELVGPPETGTLFEDVFDDVPWHLQEQKEDLLDSLGRDED